MVDAADRPRGVRRHPHQPSEGPAARATSAPNRLIRFLQGRDAIVRVRSCELDGAALMATHATQRLLVVGLSHAQAPLSLLERVVVGPDELSGVLSTLAA